MKLSLKFLNDYLDTSQYSDFEIADQMLNLGNEYDSVTKLSSARGLVIGKVLKCWEHPDSDHLTVCLVDTKDQERQIVCGAPNVKENTKVIVALPGSVLNDEFEIKKTTIRGVESSGMICSLTELGIDEKYQSEEDKLGIHILTDEAIVGEEPLTYLHYDDSVIDFDLTSNRADLLGVLGMAYEINSFIKKEISFPETKIEEEFEDINDYLKLDVQTENAPLYLVRMVKDIKIKESPKFIQARLMASGIRPINNVVDISNYVMLEYSQPLHFFDYRTLNGQIGVRMAHEKEELTTLDEIKRTLSKEDIVITTKDRAIGLAGVMGGLNSEIEIDTQDIVIESAIFTPKNIRKTASKIIRTEASNRFEKGMNPEYTYQALDRACHLLEKYAGAKVIKGSLAHDNYPKEEFVIKLSLDKTNAVLGLNLTKEEITEIFKSLALDFSYQDGVFIVKNLARRKDLQIEEDLIEELGRVYGLDKLEAKLPLMNLQNNYYDPKELYINKLKERLISYNLFEVINYTLTKEANLNLYTLEKEEVLAVENPMSEDKKYLRTSLIPSLLQNYKYNYNHQVKDVSIFEIANVYSKEKEKTLVSILVAGNLLPDHWMEDTSKYNFYHLKGLIISLLDYLALKNRYSFSDLNLPGEFHPYQSEALYIDQQLVGYLGRVHPKISKEDVFVAELNLDTLFNFKTKQLKVKEISSYPSIEVDLSFIINEELKAEDILKIIRTNGTRLLKDSYLFDYYQAEEMASLAFRLVFNDERKTLEEEEIKVIVEKIIRLVETQGGKLKG